MDEAAVTEAIFTLGRAIAGHAVDAASLREAARVVARWTMEEALGSTAPSIGRGVPAWKLDELTDEGLVVWAEALIRRVSEEPPTVSLPGSEPAPA